MLLDSEQERLLATLVEASRSVADRSAREFVVLSPDQGTWVSGGGLTDRLTVEDADIFVLADERLIRFTSEGRSMNRFRITPEGENYYAEMKARAGEPVREVGEDMRGYLDSEPFRTRYPAAYRSFTEAERLLWGPDSHDQLTAIGHHAREALQEFAAALVVRHKPPEVTPNPTYTLDRLSAVVQMHRPTLGDRRSDFLDTLFAYWQEVVNLAQRQEHGGAEGGRATCMGGRPPRGPSHPSRDG